MARHTISGQFVDLFQDRIYPAEIIIEQGKIQQIRPLQTAPAHYIMPGLVDAHVHIESSMLVPSEFARLAVIHGTVATVSDPHEIANVLGIRGVEYMLSNAASVPFKFFFGAPSCVPATSFESAGAVLNADDVAQLLDRPDIFYLSEMMNFPGVLHNDPDVMAKIAYAQKVGKPVDGHAPGLRGDAAQRYISAGISTDHECFTLEEALEKISYGMKIIIREGSAARNFEALCPLFDKHPSSLMLCSDDKHPNDLVEGHINQVVRRALERGYNLFDVLRAATVNPVSHYNLPVGLLREGDPADLIVVESPESMCVMQCWIDGEQVAAERHSSIAVVPVEPLNNFVSYHMVESDFSVPQHGGQLRVIEVFDGQIVTGSSVFPLEGTHANVVSDTTRDLLKITVVNRYTKAPPACAFVRNIGLKRGAIASSVAHDSHNIIAVGVSDAEIAYAVNALMNSGGGICAVCEGSEWVLPLPVAGLMATADGVSVAALYSEIDLRAKSLGSPLQAPFMTLSFLALLVIPQLKLSDKGLFDGEKFQFTELFE